MTKLYALFVPLFLLAGAIGYTAHSTLSQPTHITGAALPSATAVFETSLQSAITSSATTMTLTANAVRGGGTISGYNCFTIDEGSAQAETTCGTVSGTTVSSLARGTSQSTGTTTVAALQFAHRRGANVKITDFPVIQIMKAQLNGEDTIPNMISYTYNPSFTGYASSAIASKGYVDGVAVAGASNADETTKGIVELSTTAEAAAGTSAGGTGARLAIPASMCSSTFSAATLCVITSAAGKIAQGFSDLTALWTYTGGLASTGTTTISASSITTNPLKINGLAYTWASVRAASSTVLSEDGSGGLTFETPFEQVIANASSQLSTAATATTTVQVISVPANTLTTAKSLRLSTVWTVTGSQTCWIQIDYGTGSATSTAGWIKQSNNGAAMETDMRVFATSTTAVFGTLSGTTNVSDGTGTFPAQGGTAGSTRESGLYSTANITAQTYFDLRANCISGGTANLNGYTLEVLRQ